MFTANYGRTIRETPGTITLFKLLCDVLSPWAHCPVFKHTEVVL
jgi:hypothetical protein